MPESSPVPPVPTRSAVRAQWAADIETYIARLAQGPLLTTDQRTRLADLLRRPLADRRGSA